MPYDAEFTDDLARLLFALDASRLPTAAVTSAITRAIVRWAHGSGWMVRTEARVDVPGVPGGTRQLGFVDVLVSRGRGHSDVAIEIDSTDKPWSVVKLQHAAAAGMLAIWVRWGDDAWAGVYDDLDVIQLGALRRPLPRRRSPQLEMWPTAALR